MFFEMIAVGSTHVQAFTGLEHAMSSKKPVSLLADTELETAA
jgi:hypothetical protein